MAKLDTWFYCLNGKTIDRKDHDWFNMTKVAVKSCKVNTHLQPVLIYDGVEDFFTEEIRSLGSEVIFHKTMLDDLLKRNFKDPYIYEIAKGAFLRIDIPFLTNEDFALYTDVDIIFNGPIDTDENILNNIQNFMAAPQFNQEDFKDDMNTGVMVMNNRHMGLNYFEIVRTARYVIESGLTELDQEILRRVFPLERRSKLNAFYNWKPYWGYNPKASIIHFHGPKPSAVEERMRTGKPFEYESWEILYNRNVEGYVNYLQLFNSYLKD